MFLWDVGGKFHHVQHVAAGARFFFFFYQRPSGRPRSPSDLVRNALRCRGQLLNRRGEYTTYGQPLELRLPLRRLASCWELLLTPCCLETSGQGLQAEGHTLHLHSDKTHARQCGSV